MSFEVKVLKPLRLEPTRPVKFMQRFVAVWRNKQRNSRAPYKKHQRRSPVKTTRR